MYAAPFGPTLLADLGARVIKIEPLEGDAIRMLMPFPEVAGAKVMQGKESIALDLNTAEGLQIVHELAARSDIVMQGFRAGASTRCGVDAKTLQTMNPDLIYVNAPGYGIDGPFGHRPAYAPSIGAAAGLTLGDFPAADQTFANIGEIKRAAAQLSAASAIPPLQADGIAALGVASTMLLGLLGRARGKRVGELTSTMISTAAIANLQDVIDYPGRPQTARVDADGYGLDALYRMYRASDGWIFLAARSEHDTAVLMEALKTHNSALAGARAISQSARTERDQALAYTLGVIFATRSASAWESELSAKGIGCVKIHDGAPQKLLQVDPEAAAEYASAATSPIFDDHLRPAAAVHFSRSRSRAEGFRLCGENTDDILREIGYDLGQIARLRDAKRIN
jgi:crotonobetainyl-CoA:carnitine CoA-transferase CaiB-like acyl-CoA transferase